MNSFVSACDIVLYNEEQNRANIESVEKTQN